MVKVELGYNNAYNWYYKNNIYVIGHLFHENKLYQGEEFLELVKQHSIEKLKTIISLNSGFFAIVIVEQNKVTLISDIIRSFPVFYKISKSEILITDNIDKFNALENESVEELLMLGYVSGDRTLYKEAHQLENSQTLTININGKILKEKYFHFLNNNPNIFDKEEKFKEFDKTLIKTFKKMIKYLNGRTAVIPLSGGQDSRMIAYYLKKLNYPNIITYTYGNSKRSEVNISKKVAEYLNLKWVFVPYKRKSMSIKYNSKENFREISNYCGRGFSIPHIQDWEAIDYLLDKKIIDRNCVVIPGHTMDFIAGSHIRDSLLNDNISLEDLKILIYKEHYKLHKDDNSKFDLKLASQLNIDKFNSKKISTLEACNYYENWDFEERQTKFIANAVRIYDYYSLNWYLPFWDIQVVSFFKNIPINLRNNRIFFKDFVNYKYKELMDIAPLFKLAEKKKRKGFKRIISNLYAVINLYFNHYLNYYGYFKIHDYIYKILKYKSLSYNYHVALDYVKLISLLDKKL